MDLLDFSDCTLYFEEPLPAAAEELLAQAAHEYGQASAETALLRAYLLALKAASVVLLRLGQNAASRARLRKLAALDQRDQFGAARLLAVADAFEQDQEPQLTPAAA
ncbi:hypothetical protein [Candidatus Accumulibacter sp. ACC003]|uniref:hypothetical protein n=1 Tax=Candidatus Accumulibacter sp. ACC003 TaxID=2823334 RepID=UPI0025C2EC22|nr:hypothetical protein [Candidatus Accumulibacter sp. ACC003]